MLDVGASTTHFIIRIVRPSDFRGISILRILLLWINLSFIIFYNLEFRSNAIEPHQEILPDTLDDINFKEDVVLEIGGKFLNKYESVWQTTLMQ